MNNLKKFYELNGWVVYKKLFTYHEINLVKSIINDFLKNKIGEIDNKSRIINFAGKSKKNIKCITPSKLFLENISSNFFTLLISQLIKSKIFVMPNI